MYVLKYIFMFVIPYPLVQNLISLLFKVDNDAEDMNYSYKVHVQRATVIYCYLIDTSSLTDFWSWSDRFTIWNL